MTFRMTLGRNIYLLTDQLQKNLLRKAFCLTAQHAPLEYPYTLRGRVACLDGSFDLCQSVKKQVFRQTEAAPVGAACFDLAAAAVVVVAATAAVVVTAAQETAVVVAAAAEQQNQNDDPPAATVTKRVVTHNHYLHQGFVTAFAVHSMLFRRPEKVQSQTGFC